MALFRKGSTPKLAAAVRKNGRKSHGPKTEAGKQNSSLNAIRHGAYAKVDLPHMQALGEDPALFQQHLEAICSAFTPQDGCEERLARDIAVDYWRLDRLRRAEAAFLASRMQNLQRDREWKAHLARRARIDAFRDYTPARELKDLMASRADPNAVHYSGGHPEGEMNSPESPEKYAHIIGTLKTVRDVFLLKGFAGIPQGPFDMVLGHGASSLGSDLLSSFEACVQDYDQQPAESQRYKREYFLKALEDEIRYFETEFQLYLAREVEVSREMTDAQLLPSSEDLDRIIRAETHLERLIEIKRQQFFEWRREKANVGGRAVQTTACAVTGPDNNRHSRESAQNFGSLLPTEMEQPG
jgi:hypothetical protein